MTPVRLEPADPRSRVKHYTTEPLRSLSTLDRSTSARLLLELKKTLIYFTEEERG